MKPKRMSRVSFGPTSEGLHAGLCLEHLEEGSFLYEQRLGLIDDSDVPWSELDSFVERRFEAHLSALVMGTDLGLDVCFQQAKEGDFGELHTSIRVFCRQNRQDLVEEILDELDFNDDERVKAVADALCYDMPEGWQEDFLNALFEKGSGHARIAAQVVAFQRLTFERHLLQSLAAYPSENKTTLALLHALGRMRSSSATPSVLKCIEHDDPVVVKAAISTLIRMGSLQALREAVTPTWPVLDLGLCGGKGAIIHNDPGVIAGKNGPLAMGLLGAVSAVPILIGSLLKKGVAENAALALNLITGVELYEEHFIPEEIDVGSLFEDELELFRKGELYAPGEEPEETTTRLSQNPEVWQQWWEENREQFDPDCRYRNGKPYSPECLLENISSEKSPTIIRQLAYEELVIRYDLDVPFETDMPVWQQLAAIETYRARLEVASSQFIPGKWYYCGEEI